MSEITPEMLTLASITSVKIQTCITKFEDEDKRRKKYTAFIIELRTHGGLVWTVERRFSQFHQLNEILKVRYDELKLFKFPPKRWFSSFATATVEQRRRVFEVYLQELLCLQPRPVELNAFLDINAHIWGTGFSGGNQFNDGATGSPNAGPGRGDGADGGASAGGAGAGQAGAGAGAHSGAGAAATPHGVVSGGDAPVSAEFLARLRSGNVGLDDFELLRVLGKGSFGKVFLVRLIATGNVYAMKVLKKSEVVRRRQVEHTKAERRIMGGIQHPFVVALRFAFQTADKLYMVTDYCKGGELFFHLKKFRTFPEPMVRFFAAELVCALSHLHSINIVYRDLKPENVLLDEAGHIHITDFGLSKDEVVDPRGATTFCGTPEYLAPEMLINRKSREGYGKAVDYWSLGTLVYEMLTGWPPFYDKNLRKMCEQILKSELHFPPTCGASPEARDLIRGLLTRDPNQRLGCRAGGVGDIKGHPFFRGIDWERLERGEVEPPFKPRVGSDTDIGNFDTTFTSEPATLTPPAPSDLSEAAAADEEFGDFSFVNVSRLPPRLAQELERERQLSMEKHMAQRAAMAAAAANANGGNNGSGSGHGSGLDGSSTTVTMREYQAEREERHTRDTLEGFESGNVVDGSIIDDDDVGQGDDDHDLDGAAIDTGAADGPDGGSLGHPGVGGAGVADGHGPSSGGAAAMPYGQHLAAGAVHSPHAGGPVSPGGAVGSPSELSPTPEDDENPDHIEGLEDGDDADKASGADGAEAVEAQGAAVVTAAGQ